MARTKKCVQCDNTTFKVSFLATDKGLLYSVEGKPGMKNQLLGKRKKLTSEFCTNCGYTVLFTTI